MELCNKDNEVSRSTDWTHNIDRGGLFRVSENTHMVFNHIEVLVQKVFYDSIIQEMKSDLGEKVKQSAMTDEEICFY